MKIVKSLFKKALKDSKDPWLAPLDQRNTPMESSPAQRLMSRRTRALVIGVQEKLPSNQNFSCIKNDVSFYLLNFSCNESPRIVILKSFKTLPKGTHFIDEGIS